MTIMQNPPSMARTVYQFECHICKTVLEQNWFGVNAAIGDYEFMIKGDIPFPHFVAFCAQVGVPMVPLLCADATLTDRVAEFLVMADGQSLLSPGCVREGLVFKTRMATNRLSFKAISNQYLLKGDR